MSMHQGSKRRSWVVGIALCGGATIGFGQEPRAWSEAEVVQRFLTLGPQGQVQRARVSLAEAEARTHRAGDVDRLIRILRQREQEGEGSRYDRLRAEHELAEWRTDGVSGNAFVAAARARIGGFLPAGTQIAAVRGRLADSTETPEARLQAAQTRLMQFDATRSGDGVDAGVKRFVVRAPITGVLAAADAINGANTEPGKVLFRLVDIDRIFVSGIVAESDYSKLRALSGAEVEMPGAQATGEDRAAQQRNGAGAGRGESGRSCGNQRSVPDSPFHHVERRSRPRARALGDHYDRQTHFMVS